MELWEIKANALKLMFADSEMQLNKNEFSSGIVYSNGNFKDKLIRMNDSIRRAIDYYYQFCGQFSKKQEVDLVVDSEGEKTLYVDLTTINDFWLPTKIDLKVDFLGKEIICSDIGYFFDNISKTIMLDESSFDTSTLGDYTTKVVLYYTVEKKQIPSDDIVNELTFNLDTIYIPSDIQRIIPKYIKGEIYEEDEYSMAQISKNEYMQFLMNYKKKFSRVQTRVKSFFRRG